MKKLVKIATMFCFCLIFWGSNDASAQTTPLSDDLITNEFVCFCYDGGNMTSTFVPANAGTLLDVSLLIPIKGKYNRSSLEDIWKENMEMEVFMKNIQESLDLSVKKY